MARGRLLRIGVIGSLATALCCFTPVLTVLLGSIGLSAALSWLDIVLLPALAIFLVMAGYGAWRHPR